jgi:hypothetical protein
MCKKKQADERHEDGTVVEPLLRSEVPGIAPIEVEIFSRRAAEIITNAVAASDEKPSGTRRRGRSARRGF